MQYVVYDKNTAIARHRIKTNGGFSCIVRNCKHRTSEKQYKFFRLPAKDHNRLEEWLRVCDRNDLKDKSEKSLFQNYKICSQHFEKKMYANPEDLMNRLLPSAIPTLLLPMGNTNDIVLIEDEETSENIEKVSTFNVAARNKSRRKKIPGKGKFNKQLESSPQDSGRETPFENNADICQDELDIKPDPFPVKPFGDDLLRVCRTCFQIMKIEEAVPLISSFAEDCVEETKLSTRLKSLLQVDLFTVENPCLCKKCENFINGVHDFVATCRANEDVLRDFDWDCKTQNLLYVVDQDKLKAAYDQTRNVEPEKAEEDVAISQIEDPDVDSEFSVAWREQDERGNGLSDMEDHWYDTDIVLQTDHDYAAKTDMASCASSLPKEDDLFSPNFDRYFDRMQNTTFQRLRQRCKRYHNNDSGTGPYVCEFCGKVNSTKGAFWSHIKLHKSGDDFCCTACNKVFFNWSFYLHHCKSVHGGAFECPRCPKTYLYKKMLDSHVAIHEMENSKHACLICRKLFDDESLLNEHKLSHRPRKIASKLRERSVRRNFLKMHTKSKRSNRDISRGGSRRNIFRCSSCRRSYTRIGCLKMHEKFCDKER